MLQSKFVQHWKQEGELTGVVNTKREDLLECVRVRLEDPVDEAIRLTIEKTNDPAILDRWFKAALRAENLDALLREHWGLPECKIVRGWRQEGERTGVINTKREDLLECMHVRLQDPVPEAL